MRQKQGSHVETHTQRPQAIDASGVLIKFSPEVVRSFARLEAMVHDSPHFSGPLLENLQEFAKGKPVPVQLALSEMALLSIETMRYVRDTGDTRAEKALDEFTEALMGLDAEKSPVSVLVASPQVGAARK